MRFTLLASVFVATIALTFGAASAKPVPNAASNPSPPDPSVTFDFSVSGLQATGTLDVVGDQAISGTGTITGSALSGPETLTLVTLATPGVHDLGEGNLSYRFGGGTDLIGDTYFNISTPPITSDNGLVFLVSGPGNTGFNLWSDSPTAYEGFLASNTLYNDYAGGTLTAQVASTPLDASNPPAAEPAPEPVSLALLGTGLFGLGMVRRKRAQ